MRLNENTLELHVIAVLEQAGWQHVHGSMILAEREYPWRANTSEVVLTHRLREAVARLNPQLPSVVVDEVVAKVVKPDIIDIAERNHHAYRYLKEGVPIRYTVDGVERAEYARLVDFYHPEHNSFDVVNQLAIRGRRINRRPDVILYLNGLPVVMMELKNPFDEYKDIRDAYQQLQTYKDEIAEAFVFNQFLVISDGVTARVGSLTADFDRFSPWRVVDERRHVRAVFEHELDGVLEGLCTPRQLLDYIQNFIVYERNHKGATIKKIAGYHQYYGVNQALVCTLQAASEGGDGKIGVVWHTQGSGKSLSMLFYAGKVMASAGLNNPTLVIVTDRNDLDGQLFSTFSSGQELIRQTPIQADDREMLRQALAQRETGGVFFTTIQKFGLIEGELRHPVLNDRKNIIVITDEAHRSQYGFNQKLSHTGQYRTGYAQHLRDALPNASFIGFTGTPISLEDKDTRGVFGDYVSIYDIHDAVEDGATVPIIYEARQIKLEKSDEFDRVMAEVRQLEAEEQAVSQDRALRLREKLFGTSGRLSALAEDIVMHFEQRITLTDGKAMIVAMSREICVKLYDEIIKLRPDWHSDDIHSGAIKIVMTGSATDGEHLQRHLYSKDDKKTLETRFKNPDDPLKMVIVRDMWLTGFDAPCCHTMYIDKPMQGHNLMQAIARVNRVFANKSRDNGGLVVDYVGLTDALKEATATYTNAKGKGQVKVDIEEVFVKMQEYIEIIRGQFATRVADQRFDLESALASNDPSVVLMAVLKAANHIVALDQQAPPDPKAVDKTPRKNTFLQAVRHAKKGYSLCGAMSEVKAYQKELAFYDAVRATIVKNSVQKSTTKPEAQIDLMAMLNQAVSTGGVVDLFDLLHQDKPNISILSEEFLGWVKQSDTPDLWALAIEKYLKSDIKTKGSTNLSLQKDFETRVSEAMNQYHSHQLTVVQVLEMLVQMSQEFYERLARGEALGLDPSEIAFYDALAKNASAISQLGDETLKQMAIEITDKLRKSVTVDWQYKDSVRAKMRVLVRRALQRYKYPPDKQDEAVDFVIQQAEELADLWSLAA